MKQLDKLEKEFAEGKLSKRQYTIHKKVLEDKLGTVLAAERVKRLQGKGGSEKTLDYWAEKEKEEEDRKEKEELVEKYVIMPSPKASKKRKAQRKQVTQSKNSGFKFTKGKMLVLGVLIVGFLVGISFGVSLLKAPAQTSSVPMLVNDSAFPTANMTANVTNTTTNTTKTYKTNKTTTTPTTTYTYTTNTQGNTATDNGGSENTTT